MKLHKRVEIVDKAKLEFDDSVADWISRHGLTYGEVFKILSLSIADWAKYMIRDERHPNDPNKRGDEA